MDDDIKKKKNRKKKNKQGTKAAAPAPAPAPDDTASSNAGETSEQDIVINDKDKAIPPNSNGCVAVDRDNQKWLHEESKLRDMVKQLLYEKDSFIQRQADLEIRMKQLQSENDSWHEKEKAVTSCITSQVSLEQRISHLLQENAALSSEERNLLEKFQHVEKEKILLFEKESINKEMIVTLNNENARLKLQVLQLEGAGNSLTQENKQLSDNISTLQSRIQELEMSLATTVSPADAQKDVSEKEDLITELEGTYALIGKLMTENADLVEKVNELSVELGHRAVLPDATSVDMPNYSTADPVSRSTADIQDDISLSAKNVKLFRTAPIGDERIMTDEMGSDNANVARHSSETSVYGEIVQIPLDENESQDLEAQSSVIVGDESVPLADAPLIGAPFRLISFVAKYVSGADLVNESPSN